MAAPLCVEYIFALSEVEVVLRWVEKADRLPVYLSFMDCGVRDALDEVPLSLMARHMSYRAFLRSRFPAIGAIPKAHNGASVQVDERSFRSRQYVSDFMRHVVYLQIYSTGGRLGRLI
jgi:hypothetical protein